MYLYFYLGYWHNGSVKRNSREIQGQYKEEERSNCKSHELMQDSEKGYEKLTFDLAPCIKGTGEEAGEEAGRRDESFQMRSMPRHGGSKRWRESMNIKQRANAFLFCILGIHASTFIKKNKQTNPREMCFNHQPDQCVQSIIFLFFLMSLASNSGIAISFRWLKQNKKDKQKKKSPE